jgi:hypothetical protein
MSKIVASYIARIIGVILPEMFENFNEPYFYLPPAAREPSQNFCFGPSGQ